MQTKLEIAPRQWDTYCCREVTFSSKPEGVIVTMLDVTMVTRERPASGGQSVYCAPMVTEKKALTLPADGRAIYLLDDRGNTTNVLRVRREVAA